MNKGLAAVPQYLGDQFQTASPGMRFGYYLPLWMEGSFKRLEDKTDALKKACAFTEGDKQHVKRLVERQAAMAEMLSAERLCRLEAKSTAPFSTGLGNEHPLENGFAFLNPYGLPYLAGSGVKGVLRQAARELAGLGEYEWDIDSKWDQARMDALFGKEDSNNAQRGALQFWDVIPEMGRLQVEVMTPHQGHYYKDADQPHDSGQPIPINFVTVPAKTDFVFHVVCDETLLHRVTPCLLQEWQTLLEEAFEHAFEWLGFGAKTAVGYGAMEWDRVAHGEEKEKHRQEVEESAHLATLSPVERDIEGVCKKHKGNNPASALLKKLDAGEWQSPEDQRLVAEKIRSLWQAEKKWNPDFSGTNKAKVKQKKHCETVLNYLDG
ncbi:MAG: type III-B CRISPR module RAMP protein Cmr6 [Gammaproteobacteria bacterium]|nr:type III-B CRISPR module RAMP protein Cmr6 [Gammaproteobacteria bacterium]